MAKLSRLVIVTGGQTGVDRAALDVAIELTIPYSGFCPHGGWAEDLPEPPGLLARYPLLRETPSADPAQRTEWNVRDSDAMLILAAGSGLAASPGTTLALGCAGRGGNPLTVIALDQPDATVNAIRWLDDILSAHPSNAPLHLGVGGPRESEAPGIYVRSYALLIDLLRGR